MEDMLQWKVKNPNKIKKSKSKIKKKDVDEIFLKSRFGSTADKFPLYKTLGTF